MQIVFRRFCREQGSSETLTSSTGNRIYPFLETIWILFISNTLISLTCLSTYLFVLFLNKARMIQRSLESLHQSETTAECKLERERIKDNTALHQMTMQQLPEIQFLGRSFRTSYPVHIAAA